MESQLVMAGGSWDQGERRSCCKQRGVNSLQDDRCLHSAFFCLLLLQPRLLSGIAAMVTQHSSLGIAECSRH